VNRHTTTPSIRARLAQAWLVVALAWTLAAGAAVWLVVRHEIHEVLDHALQESGELMYGMLSMPATAALLAQQHGGALPAPRHQENLVWQVVGPGQSVLLRSHGAPAAPLLAQPAEGLSDAGHAWRVHGLALEAPAGAMLYVAQPGWERQEAELEAAFLSGLAALLVGVAGTVWVRTLIRRELRPLEELSEAVAAYDPLDPSHGLPVVDRAELLPMQQAIHTLGQRVARRMASERAFSAHAAHALRTPLAGIDAQLAVAVRECPPAVTQRLQRIRHGAQRLQQVVVALLALFRSSAEPQWQAVDVAALVHRLPVAGLRVYTRGLAQIHADPDLLAAALANLFDNAVRLGATAVVVDTASTEEGSVLLSVIDDGSGMSSTLRSALSAELESGRYARPLGLGLMLADLVARAHGGHASLPAPTVTAGAGTVVCLHLRHQCLEGQARAGLVASAALQSRQVA
jgi:signal transduction histidine kinase